MERKGRVEGKVALITGVAKTNSIGFNTARVFGEEGALLAIVDISPKVHDCADELRTEGFTVSSHTADLTKMDEVRKAVAEAVTCHGRIDVLVNNAGMVIEGMEEDFTDFAHMSEKRLGLRHRHQPQDAVQRDAHRDRRHDRTRLRAHRQRLVGHRSRWSPTRRSRCTAPPRPGCWA